MSDAAEEVRPNGQANETPFTETEQPRRKRGRPRKEDIKEESVTDGEEKPRKKRGPKPGSKRKRSWDQEARLALANNIKGLHQIAGTVTGLEELYLQDQECMMLADSVANVAQEYNLALDGKTGAAIQLAATAAIIYLPRVAAINKRMQESKPLDGEVVNDANTETQ